MITPSHADEYERSSVFLGLYIALLMEATACTLVWLGFRLGEAALIWAGALS